MPESQKTCYVKDDRFVYKVHRVCRIKRILRNGFDRNYRKVVVGRRESKRVHCTKRGTEATEETMPASAKIFFFFLQKCPKSIVSSFE